MAHFAELDKNNVVLRVLVVDNDKIIDENGNEVEQKGIDFLKNILGEDTKWIQTSYSGSFRKNYAGGSYTYNVELDAFIPPKPFQSWLLDEVTCQWFAPSPYPNDGKEYYWDENTTSWVEQ